MKKIIVFKHYFYMKINFQIYYVSHTCSRVVVVSSSSASFDNNNNKNVSLFLYKYIHLYRYIHLDHSSLLVPPLLEGGWWLVHVSHGWE